MCIRDRCKDVVLIKLIPGMNPQLFDKLAEMDIRGIVIEAFGAGGINFVRRDLISELEKIVSRGISVVAVSYTHLDVYKRQVWMWITLFAGFWRW